MRLPADGQQNVDESGAAHFRALLALKCPRCHTGNLFLRPARDLRDFDKMPPVCPVCAQTYEPEPGFYYGAMYISYGFGVIVVALVGVALYWLAGDPSVGWYVTAVALSMVLITPLSFRYARAVMLYAFGSTRYQARFDPGARPSEL